MASELRALVERVREARVEAEACYCRDSLTCQLCGAVMGAEGELATWLLAHPEAVEAVEVLREMGVARAKEREADRVLHREPSDEHGRAWGVLADALVEVEERVAKLADALAGGG